MSANHRTHSRYEINLPVEVEFQGKRVAGMTLNISLGGMFISCPEVAPFGERVQLRFELELLSRPVVTEAVVRWVDPAAGIGLQFTGLRALEVWALQKTLAHRPDG